VVTAFSRSPTLRLLVCFWVRHCWHWRLASPCWVESCHVHCLCPD